MNNTIFEGTGNPSDCFIAQTIPSVLRNQPLNPDIGGIAVGIANIASNAFLPLLLRFSDKQVQTSVVILLSQVYPNLIATAFSAFLSRGNLSLFDAHFALAVAASPVTFYICFSAYLDAFRFQSTLFNRITSSKRTIRFLYLLLPWLWIGLHLYTSFSTTAFRNSDLCHGMTFTLWLEFQVVSNFVGVLDVMGMRDLWNDIEGRGGLGAVSLAAMWVWGIYLTRHRDDIYCEFVAQCLRDKPDSPVYKRWPRKIWRVPATCFRVIIRAHPWMFFMIIVCLHWSWILGIVKGMEAEPISLSSLSYGQVLSLFSILPPLKAVLELIKERSKDGMEFVRQLPGSLSRGILFLATGSPTRNSRQSELESPYRIEKNRHFNCKLAIPCFLILNTLDILWIIYYVKAGTTPNPRTIINNPHKAWKPFSVALYVFGYLLCCFNVYVWINYTDSCIDWFCHGKMERNDNRFVPHLQRTRIFRTLFILINLIFVLPAGFIMCVGPLFSPFAGMPLAEEYQWNHLCSPFFGEVILQGRSYTNQNSLASFYYDVDSGLNRQLSFKYELLPMDVNGSRIFLYTFPDASNYTAVSSSLITNLTFNAKAKEIIGYCGKPNSTQTECMQARFDTSPYLNFTVDDFLLRTSMTLKTLDKEWHWGDDAPSFILEAVDKMGSFLGKVLQTAVTRRNYCDTLKVCLGTPTPGAEVLAALAVALDAQDKYATYCTMPRLYAI